VFLSMAAVFALGAIGSMSAKAQASPFTILNTKVDQNFIHNAEASPRTVEVPLPQSSKSGVTIGDGCDLGQLSIKEFNHLEISNALKQKLRPYVGLKRYDALDYLRRHPLYLSHAEVKQLDVAMEDVVLFPLIKYYDRVSRSSFLSLPAAAQTALFSYAYQYGPAFKYQSGALWAAFVNQNWSKASNELRNSSEYRDRRLSEAHLLEKLTNEPWVGVCELRKCTSSGLRIK